MVAQLSVAEAKAKFSECVRDAEDGAPVVITRNGRAVAAIVSVDDLALLERVKAASEGRGLAMLAGGWEGSDELVEAMQRAPRSGRKVGSAA